MQGRGLRGDGRAEIGVAASASAAGARGRQRQRLAAVATVAGRWIQRTPLHARTGRSQRRSIIQKMLFLFFKKINQSFKSNWLILSFKISNQLI